MDRTVGYLLAKATRPAPPRTVERWMIDGMLDGRGPAGWWCGRARGSCSPRWRRPGVPYGLVTSSQRVFAEAVLASTGMTFPVTVCAEDVTATKPDPAPYLLAAKLLDADPARCVVLEDSPNGVASATAAGLPRARGAVARADPARPGPPGRPLAARGDARHPPRAGRLTPAPRPP